MRSLLIFGLFMLAYSTVAAQNYQFYAKAAPERYNVFDVESLKGSTKASLVAGQNHRFYYFSGDKLYTADTIVPYKTMLTKSARPAPGTKGNYELLLDKGPASIRLDSARFSSANIKAPDWSLRMASDTFERLSLEHYKFNRGEIPLFLTGLHGDFLQIGASTIDRSPFASDVKIKNIILFSDTVTTNLSFYGFELPSMISLQHLRFKDDGSLDLTTFSYIGEQRCSLFVTQIDLSKVKLNYAQFDIVKNGMGIYDLETFYKALLLNQQQAGFKDGYQKADIELRKLESARGDKFEKLADFVQEHWNNYGYSKEKIFVNALILFAIFFAFNLIGYGRLLRDAYTIEQIKTAYEKLPEKHWAARPVLYVFYGLFFTGIVFWGLKLDPEKLQLKTNAFLALWILVQYLAGLIVLAYIANIIIGK